MALPAGLEPAYLPIRSRVLLQLSYAKKVLVHRAEFEPGGLPAENRISLAAARMVRAHLLQSIY